MKKIILLLFVVAFSESINAQLPAYVPTNGLISWWGLDGNGTDLSGNKHNGSVTGPIPSDDRYSNPGHAYFFDGIDDNIIIPDSTVFLVNTFTINAWIRATSPNFDYQTIFSYYTRFTGNVYQGYWMGILNNRANIFLSDSVSFAIDITGTDSIVDQQWHMITATYNSLHEASVYVDGILENTMQFDVTFGLARAEIGNSFLSENFTGDLDEIGVWGRALSQEEINALYASCNVSFIFHPQPTLVAPGSDAHFAAISNDPAADYVWQTDFGLGFQDLLNVNQYSGANTFSLTVSNVSLSNHLQPFRLLSSDSGCADTSDTAILILTDTCIVTIQDTNHVIVHDTTFVSITDTSLITVDDTLIINVVISASPPLVINTIRVFPNPASTHIIIDFGDFALMNGFTLQIDNAIGATVYSDAIHQQQVEIDLSSWTGKGLYYVTIFDPQGHIVAVKKIVLQ